MPRHPTKTAPAAKSLKKDPGQREPQSPTLPIEGSARVPSIREVALLAKVGLGTVSRVINGGANVSARTRERVMLAIAELGYVPDIVAQSMRNRRTMTMACVVRDFTVPVLNMFVEAMQKEIDAEGFSLIVASSYHDLERELALLQRLKQRRVDGLVIATSSESNERLHITLKSMNCPVVLLDREAPADIDAVLVDHRKGIVKAVEHIAGLGHQRIGFITGDADLHPTSNRLKGYRDGLRKAGIGYLPELVRMGSFGADAGYHHAQSLLALRNRPTALVAGGTSLLSGVLKAVREAGLHYPEDVSIVGGADNDFALFLEPSITRVRWNHDDLGAAAGRMLMQRLKQAGPKAQRMLFDSQLVLGGSCGEVPRESKPG
jgi:LacI family transcriptional regulator